MTELQVFLTFLLNLPSYKGQSRDVERMGARLRYIINHEAYDLAVQLLHDLLSFDDAVVTGLNTGLFELDATLSRYPNSVLPKLLYGLTSQIFDPSGQLLQVYSIDAVEALLTGLRLIRRAQIPGSSSVSVDKAIDEFIAPQVAPVPTINEDVTEAMTTFWSVITEDFDDHITLGFPGSGVTKDMRFPYVPTMSIVNPFTLPPPIRLTMQKAYQRFLPDAFDVTSDCEFIKVYNYIPYPERVVTLSVVPKSFKVGRAITVTNTSSVIIGATLRETLWNCARSKGIIRSVNVHNQSLSHQTLIKYPSKTFRRDVRGGSTCILVELQKAYLSRSRAARSLFEFSIPSAIEVKGRLIDLRTLTMGDASCTALLTLDMYGFVVISQIYSQYGMYCKVTRERVVEAMNTLTEEGLTNCVGDDVQGPQRLAAVFDVVSQSQGVIKNVKKSSDANDNHLETCGCWMIRDPITGAYRRVFPFRAPNFTKDLVSDLSTLMRSYERTVKSSFSVAILIAYATQLTHQLEYLDNESFRTDHIGSPIGFKPYTRSVRLKPRKRCLVNDDVAYAFRCAESSVEPKFTRRPALDRGRIVKSRDLIREQSVTSIDQTKVFDTYVASETTGSVGSKVASIFALSLLLTSPARHLIDVR